MIKPSILRDPFRNEEWWRQFAGEKRIGDSTLREFLEALVAAAKPDEDANLLEKHRQEFLACTTGDMISLERIFLRSQLGIFSVAVEAAAEKYKSHGPYHLTCNGPAAVGYEQLPVDVDETRSFITNASWDWNYHGVKLCVSLGWEDLREVWKIEMYASSEHREIAVEALAEIEQTYKGKNYLRGKKILYLPEGEIRFMKSEEANWNDIIIDETACKEIMRNTLNILDQREKYAKNGLPTKRGVIFYGPPGVGKTLMSRLLVNSCKHTVIMTASGTLHHNEYVANIFTLAKELAPTLLILEDIDLVAQDRSFYNSHTSLGELLNQLDGLDTMQGVVIIATTNAVDILDKAISERPSRFDRRIEFKFPGAKDAEKLLSLFLSQPGPKNEESVDLERVSKKLAGLSGAYIREVVITARMKAVEEDRETLTQEDFSYAVDIVRPIAERTMSFLGARD